MVNIFLFFFFGPPQTLLLLLLLFWTAALAERSGLQLRPLDIGPWRFRRSRDAVKIEE
jgi:hypothetical protein